MLAIAAFHLAYLRPERHKEYNLQATHHQSQAIEGIRNALTSITTENCHALFAASTFLFVGSLAASRPSPGTTDFSLDNLVDIFLLLKGVRGIIDSTNELGLADGPLRELFHPMLSAELGPGPVRLMGQIQKLSARIPEITPTAGDRDAAVILREAERLIESIEYAGRTSKIPEYQVIASWPLSISETFIGLLRRRNQAALAVLSYYCVIMHSTEEEYWFTKGWSMCVVNDIAKVMSPPWNQDSAWAEAWITGRAVLHAAAAAAATTTTTTNVMS